MPSVERRLILQVAPVLLWGAAVSIAWYFDGASYERLLASLASAHLPNGVYLHIGEHVFSIGLVRSAGLEAPALTILSHNFGFGLVVTGATILGARTQSWPIRSLGLGIAWALLLTVQVGLLVGLQAAVGHAYPQANEQVAFPVGLRVLLRSVHPIVAVFPVAIVVMWLLIPPGVSLHLPRRRPAISSRSRPQRRQAARRARK